jgi:hypothetical protein
MTKGKKKRFKWSDEGNYCWSSFSSMPPLSIHMDAISFSLVIPSELTPAQAPGIL